MSRYDRVKTKKVKDWGLEHSRYIDDWMIAGRNDRYTEATHQNHLFFLSIYVGYLGPIDYPYVQLAWKLT